MFTFVELQITFPYVRVTILLLTEISVLFKIV